MNFISYPNFTEAEFTCKCGCEQTKMDPLFLARLQNIRDIYNKPITITSGYRCPAHNNKVSSTGPNGPHTTGKACDINIAGEDAFSLLEIALRCHTRGIGLKQHGPWSGRFLHLDTIESDIRPRVWTYT